MKRTAIAIAAATCFTAAYAGGDHPSTQSQSLPQQGEHSDLSASSEVITKAQEALHARGYDAGPIEGVQTAQMTEALKQAQSDNLLEPTGELDGQTLAVLGVIEPESESGAFSSGESPSS